MIEVVRLMDGGFDARSFQPIGGHVVLSNGRTEVSVPISDEVRQRIINMLAEECPQDSEMEEPGPTSRDPYASGLPSVEELEDQYVDVPAYSMPPVVSPTAHPPRNGASGTVQVAPGVEFTPSPVREDVGNAGDEFFELDPEMGIGSV